MNAIEEINGLRREIENAFEGSRWKEIGCLDKKCRLLVSRFASEPVKFHFSNQQDFEQYRQLIVDLIADYRRMLEKFEHERREAQAELKKFRSHQKAVKAYLH